MSLEQIFSEVYEQAPAASGDGWIPIQPSFLPLASTDLLTHGRLIIGGTSAASRPTWDLGAWMQFVRVVQDGVAVASDRYPILLNRHYQLVDVPPWFTPYRLYLTFPHWLQSVNITVFAENP